MSKKTKAPQAANYTALEKIVEAYVDIYTRLRRRAPMPLARQTKGLANGSAPTQIDFKCELELLVRRTIKDSESRKAFWRFVFSPLKKDSEGVERKMQVETWASRFGDLRSLIPSTYFRAVLRDGAKDTSPICSDNLPRMDAIRKKYERLRKNYELLKAQQEKPLARAAQAQQADTIHEQSPEAPIYSVYIAPDSDEPDDSFGYERAETTYRNQYEEAFTNPDAFARQEQSV
jgi:hypothetical protein